MRLKFTPPSFESWRTIEPDKFADQSEAYFLRVRDFYDSRARWHRRFYRVSGILLIVLGVLVAEGLANKQIARTLGIAERTVKAHLTSAFQRIGVADRTQAALWAQRHDLGGRPDAG